MPNKTASAKSAVQQTGSDIQTQENFEACLVSGLDKVWKREWMHPREGEQFFRSETTNKKTLNFQNYRSIGTLVEQNRDADDIPYDTRGEGFSHSVTTNNYRKGIAIEKTLTETDQYGVVRNMQSDLAENAKIGLELVMADVFNRGVNPTNAPLLAEDGMYFIDSDRPNAYARAGTWSNEESVSAITPNSIFQCQLNFAAHKDEIGQLSPLQLKRMIIRPQDQKTVWEILRSDLRPTDAMNAKNFQYGRFEYTIYNFLTDAAVYYMANDGKSPKNELAFYWRVHPGFKTWLDGSNPDITRQRVRFSFGLGLGRPYMWRGGEVS